jgi:sister chromatid cohesion protein PDS5
MNQAIADEVSSSEEADFEGVAARVAALAQIARHSPTVFEHRSSVFMTFLLKKVLMVPAPADQVSKPIHFLPW